MKRIVRVIAEKFEAGFETDGEVLRASSILKFMIGWSDSKARAVIKNNGWEAFIVTDEARAAEIRAALDLATDPPPGPATETFGERLCHCGKVGWFGYDVSTLRGQDGTWYCSEHWPDRQRLAA